MYIPFTDEQKQLAESVDLESFLRLRGERVERVGRESKLVYYDGGGKHDSITIKGSKWFDHKNRKGGGPVRFMQEFYGMDFKSAVLELLGQPVMPVSHSPPEKNEFRLPEKNSDMHRVFAYLIQKRFINPKVITFFAKQHVLYEDKAHHNAVFVGCDEKGVPVQAHARSTNSVGKNFRITCRGSDTAYSFSHFGSTDKLFVFEAPVDMLSFITMNPDNWQQHSYISMNGVSEAPVMKALKLYENLQEIVICTDNDEGGIDAADRIRDILHKSGYSKVTRLCPEYKDWNECLKAQNGQKALPAVSHRRKEEYMRQADSLSCVTCSPEKLHARINAAYRNSQYQFLADYALSGAEYLSKSSDLKDRLKREYRAYADKGKPSVRQERLERLTSMVLRNIRDRPRTAEETERMAQLLYELADAALRVSTDISLSEPVQTVFMSHQ